MGSFIHGGKSELMTERQGKSDFLLALTCSKASVASECVIFNLFLPMSDLSLVTLKSTGAISQGIETETEVVCVLEPRTASSQSNPRSCADPKRCSTSQISQQPIFWARAHVLEKHGVTKKAAGPSTTAQDVLTVTLPLLFSPAGSYF